MGNLGDLYKLIENLNLRIKKLDNQMKNRTLNFDKNNIFSNNQSNALIKAFSISYPKNQDKGKKYIGLMFDDNFNDFTTDTNKSVSSKIPFIKLKKGNNIINYSLCIDIQENSSENINSICLGIKDKSTARVRIIKGSKYSFNLSNKINIINNKITINNTIIYYSDSDEELCMIADINSKCKINSSKSLIKILTL